MPCEMCEYSSSDAPSVHHEMTRKLECIAEGCTATIEAETDDAVMEHASEHAAEAHPELELDEATVRELRSNITDA